MQKEQQSQNTFFNSHSFSHMGSWIEQLSRDRFQHPAEHNTSCDYESITISHKNIWAAHTCEPKILSQAARHLRSNSQYASLIRNWKKMLNGALLSLLKIDNLENVAVGNYIKENSNKHLKPANN